MHLLIRLTCKQVKTTWNVGVLICKQNFKLLVCIRIRSTQKDTRGSLKKLNTTLGWLVLIFHKDKLYTALSMNIYGSLGSTKPCCIRESKVLLFLLIIRFNLFLTKAQYTIFNMDRYWTPRVTLEEHNNYRIWGILNRNKKSTNRKAKKKKIRNETAIEVPIKNLKIAISSR